MATAQGRLHGRRAVITGAGQGIGRAAALAFAAEGAEVLAFSRTASKMADLPGLNPAIRPVAVDILDPAALAQALEAAGEVDILLNCAGIVFTSTTPQCSDAEWEATFALNVTAPFRAIRQLLPGMTARGRGSIINVASVASSITGVNERVSYGASKAALIGLTKAVAREVVGAGVRCNALCPGTTHSPSLEGRIQDAEDPEAARARFISRQPMGRLGRVEEIAASALFLASEDSAFMTGQLLVVDGGQTL